MAPDFVKKLGITKELIMFTDNGYFAVKGDTVPAGKSTPCEANSDFGKLILRCFTIDSAKTGLDFTCSRISIASLFKFQTNMLI